MSPLPRLYHHDIIAIVGLFTYRQYVIYICAVGVLKVANLHCSRQQCVIVKWSGCSIAVRVRVRARAREWNFSFFFSLCRSVRKELCCGMVSLQ